MSILFALFIMLGTALLIGLALLFDRRGTPTVVNLLPYQRGVLFRHGKPLRDVGSGKHRVWSGSELLVHGDIRPISVTFENQVVALQDGFAALYGFSASAQVNDIRKAMYSARDYSQIPAFVLLRCVRRYLNQSNSNSLKAERDAIVKRIEDESKSQLKNFGFELINFRLGQLAIGTTQPPQNQSARTITSNE